MLGTYTDEEAATDERIACARKGMTAVVVRNEVGQEFVDAANAGGDIHLFDKPEETARQFLTAIHDVGKQVCNGSVSNTRTIRGQAVYEYL